MERLHINEPHLTFLKASLASLPLFGAFSEERQEESGLRRDACHNEYIIESDTSIFNVHIIDLHAKLTSC